MKEIFVYVEGPSDQMGMQRLLSTAIESAAAQGTAVSFIPMNQNHHLPPKRIVEMLFSNAGKKYKDTADVPWVLERSDFQDLKTKCPQNFVERGTYITL
jgi:hypothetical protein